VTRKIVTTLCPGGKERMHRLLQMIAQPLVVISSTSICAAAKERSYRSATEAP